MKANRAIVLGLVFIWIVGTFTSAGASLNVVAAEMPWTKQALIAQDGIQNLSSAFVGKYNIPMLSYSRTGYHTIFQAHLATSAVPGDCGPNNSWKCSAWSDPDLLASTLSNMAAETIIDTHIIKWVYSTGTYLRGRSLELMNDMSFVTSQMTNLIQISKFGATVIGAPSLYASGGHYWLAVTIRDSSDFYGHQLVYMHYTGVSNTSCINSGSNYQCDVIDSSYGYGSMGAPSLQVDPAGTVGIAYYKSGEVMYAYPHTPTMFVPSNCGPGNNTWRCITMFAGQPTGTVGSVVKMAFGQEWDQRGIAFTYDDEMIPVTLYHAEYVGSGGNCGSDLNSMGSIVSKFYCEDLVYFYNLYPGSMPSFSIDIDPQGYSVIAYDYAMSDLGNIDLYLIYPKARLGSGETGWWTQMIDGAYISGVDTGALAALSISDSGLGLIGYLQTEDYETDILKAAWQQWQFFLPLETRR
jgi:hypothetical protein